MATKRVRAAAGDIEIVELSPEEGKALLDSQARKYLNMSGEEFIRMWEAKEFENPDDSNVLRIALLIPFARS